VAGFLAHQGGWDELAWFALPIVLVVLGVRWAERRARARAEESEAVADDAASNMPDDSAS